MLMTKRMKSYHQHLGRSHENLARRHLPKGSQPHQLQQLKQPQFLYHLRLKPSHRQQAKPIPTMSNQMRMMGLTPWLQISSKKHIQRQNATSGCASFTDAFSCLHQAFKERNRVQHACQVKRILEETDPHGSDIVFLTEEEGNRVWVDWIIPQLKKRKPGTLKSYLTSFELFLEFVSKKGKRPNLPELDVEVKNQLFDLCNSLKKWRRCITKETSSAKWDRYLDESDHLLTNEEVEDIMSLKPAADGRAALAAADQADDIKGLSISQYC